MRCKSFLGGVLKTIWGGQIVHDNHVSGRFGRFRTANCPQNPCWWMFWLVQNCELSTKPMVVEFWLVQNCELSTKPMVVDVLTCLNFNIFSKDLFQDIFRITSVRLSFKNRFEDIVILRRRL
ncbi:hypothetical protein A8F94_09065 [Bacillus sp. FJAT-27225]|nr:hypothetical protein A8F94_09065 [Bacillus sp. FJAT-27225]